MDKTTYDNLMEAGRLKATVFARKPGPNEKHDLNRTSRMKKHKATRLTAIAVHGTAGPNPHKRKKKERRPQYNPKEAYQSRRLVLLQLGFRTYDDYLQSDLWKQIRKSILKRDRRQCRACLVSQATEVHHRDYSHGTMSGRCPCTLVSLCRECHEAMEFDAGKKTSIQQANAKFFAIRRQAKHELRPRPPNDDLTAEYRQICG